jgi:hypothetical protein
MRTTTRRAVGALLMALSVGTLAYHAVGPTGSTAAGQEHIIPVSLRLNAPGNDPSGIGFDGSALLVTDNAGAFFRIDKFTAAVTGYQPPAVPDGQSWAPLRGVTWDGSSYYVYNLGPPGPTVTRFTIVDTRITPMGTFASPIPEGVEVFAKNDLAWGDGHLRVSGEFLVYEVDSYGTVLGSFTSDRQVLGVDWDGTAYWTAHQDVGRVVIRRVDRTGKILACALSPLTTAESLTWAEDALWALGRAEGASIDTLYKLDVSTVGSWPACVADGTSSATTPATASGPRPTPTFAADSPKSTGSGDEEGPDWSAVSTVVAAVITAGGTIGAVVLTQRYRARKP